jgi:hypothetical protein
MDIDIAYDPLLIDDENRALGKTFCPKHAIFQGCQTMWPEIAEQWVRNIPQ